MRNNSFTIIKKELRCAFRECLVTKSGPDSFDKSVYSAYFLFDPSFVPQSGLKAGKAINPSTNKLVGEPVDPQRNNDLELGFKHNWFGNKLLTTINGFHTVKRNVLVNDIPNAALGYKRQIGAYTSNGVELDILGNITSQLSISANYTFVNAKITKDTVGSPLVGFKLPGTPQQIINTWVQYIFPLQQKNSLVVSFGQATELKRATYTRDVYLPNYTKLDAGITFNTPKYYIRFITDNLLNKRYVASGDIGDGYQIPEIIILLKATRLMPGFPLGLGFSEYRTGTVRHLFKKRDDKSD